MGFVLKMVDFMLSMMIFGTKRDGFCRYDHADERPDATAALRSRARTEWPKAAPSAAPMKTPVSPARTTPDAVGIYDVRDSQSQWVQSLTLPLSILFLELPCWASALGFRALGGTSDRRAAGHAT